MTNLWKNNSIRLVAIFLASIIIYLLIARYYHAPQGYYGTTDQPRFADPWIARSETILNGGLLYRDVFTTTPPLTNLLLIPPSLIPIYFGNINPWATLSYMLWFSLFNLFAALVGATSKARKGTSFAHVRRLLEGVDPEQRLDGLVRRIHGVLHQRRGRARA